MPSQLSRLAQLKSLDLEFQGHMGIFNSLHLDWMQGLTNLHHLSLRFGEDIPWVSIDDHFTSLSQLRTLSVHMRDDPKPHLMLSVQWQHMHALESISLRGQGLFWPAFLGLTELTWLHTLDLTYCKPGAMVSAMYLGAVLQHFAKQWHRVTCSLCYDANDVLEEIKKRSCQ